MRRVLTGVLVATLLTGCDYGRDVGSDMAACQIDEMKTTRRDRSEKERWLKAETNAGNAKELADSLARERLDFIRTCMRSKGWDVRSEDPRCYPEGMDEATCYKRVTL